MRDPDDYYEQVWTWGDGDDASVKLDKYEVQKCAAILDAFVEGFDSLEPAVRDVVRFLHYRAIEASGVVMSESSDAIWERIERLSPPPGKPRPQP